MHRCAVHVRHFHGNVIGLLCIFRRHGTHGADHGTGEGTGRYGLNVGFEHGHVASLGNVANFDALPHQRLLEGEGAADQEAHIALLPVIGGIGDFLDKHAVFVDAVLGNVGADVSALSHVMGFRGPLDDLQNGAGEGIFIGILLEVCSIFRRQNHEIGLGEAAAHTGGGEVNDAFPDQLANLTGCHVYIGCDVKCHDTTSLFV